MPRKSKDVNAYIVQQTNGKFEIMNYDTGESMGTDFPTREAAEQSALDHDCYIVSFPKG